MNPMLSLIQVDHKKNITSLTNLLTTKYITRTLLLGKNISSAALFLKMSSAMYTVHPAVPRLLLLSYTVVGNHECCITAICWTVPCSIYSGIAMACLKTKKTEMFLNIAAGNVSS